jgi:diguanylate cyclase (GGDEF)-like protein
VKPDWVYSNKFTESYETGMVTKSTAAEGQDRKTQTMSATQLRRNPSNTGPSFPNEYRGSRNETTQTTKQQLIKILVCDDAPAGSTPIRTYLRQITNREIALLEAGHTEEIQKALDRGRIDLVFMDNQMPGKSGMEWLAEIAKRQLAPVVILTGSGSEEIAGQAFPEGAIGYLSKGSLSQEKLGNIIDVALDKWRRLQQAMADKEKLERLATFDSLTGLYNRRAILGKLRDLVTLANRYREDFSLIMLDIDHLKKVNDRYGHLTGDEVLEKIATLVRGNVRDTDIVGRYGGEEFIIILPKTNLSSSWVVAERLRGIIEKAEMKDPAGSVFTITVSQGLAAWERDDDPTSLISRVDEALYKAKEKGQNRVQILLGPSLRDKV